MSELEDLKNQIQTLIHENKRLNEENNRLKKFLPAKGKQTRDDLPVTIDSYKKIKKGGIFQSCKHGNR